MVSKTSKIAITDATQKKGSAALTTAKKKPKPQDKKTVEKTPVLDVKKGFFFSGKKSDLGSAFKESSQSVSVGAALAKKEQTKKGRISLAQKRETQTPSEVASVDEKVGQKESSSWMLQIPDTLPARMRIVTYIGVVYILLGVCGASYALADMYGIKIASPIMPLDALVQKASTIESYYRDRVTGENEEQSYVRDATINTTLPTISTTTPGEDVTTNDSISATQNGLPNDTTASEEVHLETDVSHTASTTVSSPALREEARESTTTDSLSPAIEISFPEKMPFHDIVTFSVAVAGAEKVEFAVLPKNALTPYYLGRAYKVPEKESLWRFAWNTKNVPNGAYYLVAQVKNRYGMYMSEKKYIGVLNPVATTSNTTRVEERTPSAEVAEAITTIETEMPSLLREPDATTTERARLLQKKELEIKNQERLAARPLEPGTLVEREEVQTERASVAEEAAIKAERNEDIVDMQRSAFKNQLLLLIERFAVAYRAKDAHVQDYIKKEMDSVREESMAKLKKRSTLAEGNLMLIEKEFDALIEQEIARIETRERMITERVGDAVAKDSDNDGIVDYDEVTLYKTDPDVADSDNDGFTDGAEVMSGYDPVDSDREAMVAFENPESEGLVREDILAVASIDTERAEEKVVGARLSGKGLPNSFITLYVFSTPVVITVRTNEDGSWSYIFDKELEDGAHTVYVGITDNAGRIVAKSKPFAFVKTAEAFTGQTAEGVQTAPIVEEPEFFSASTILLLSALVLTMLGGALVALGAYFMRPQEYFVVPSLS